MGGSSYRVGIYKLLVMDWFYDDIPEDGVDNRQFFDNLFIRCDVEKIGVKQVKELSVQCSKLFTIEDCGDHCFDIAWPSAGVPGPREWLFEKLNKEKKVIDIIPILRIDTNTSLDEKYWENIPNYYLQSDIYSEDIKVGMKPRTFVIEKLSQIEWLAMRGFGYSRPFYPAQGSE